MTEPLWKRASEMSKAAMTVWALVALLAGSVGGYVWRHFTGPELAVAHDPIVQQIPGLAEIVTNSQATLDEIVQERGEAAQRTKFIAEACARGDYPHARCKGYPHPDDAQEAE